MGQIVVKHFKRVSASSDDKELITELVVESSDTGRFLKRMEESRLTRPCFQTIDMRGRVAGECRRYAFNDRVHYLDDISFQMFEQGLRVNNGVYTVGTFEAIVGGSHTIQARVNAAEDADRHREEVERRRLERAQAAARVRAGEAGTQQADAGGDEVVTLADNPEILSLGYFRKRSHQRLQYACPVVLERGNIRTNGTTRDISVGGLRVLIKGLTVFNLGQDVLVSFRGLPSGDGAADTERVAYRILKIKQRQAETVLSLKRIDVDRPAGLTEAIEDLVDQHQRKYKLDIEDEFHSVLCWIYERSYAQNASQVPVFVELTEGGAQRVQAVSMSEGNSHLVRFFCTDADNYNFTPLCLPQRLQQLGEGGAYILAMYRSRGENDECRRIHSAANIEFDSPQAFHSFVNYALQQSEHCIVKVHVSAVPAIPVSEKKIEEVSERLKYKSETQMNELRDRLRRVHLVAYMVDVTRDFARHLQPPADTGTTGLHNWVGTESRQISDGAVIEKLDLDAEHLRPELIRFGYVERRREDRYLAETKVEVRVGETLLTGMSKDISTRGMRIRLDRRVTVKKGITIKVGLVSLQQKKSSTNLMDIPYRVVDTRDEEGKTELMLERVLGGKREGLKEFFVELITKNQHKLGVDIGDIRGATVSRVYEALLAANTPSIPFFLARSAEGGAHLQFVGKPESEGPLQAWFECQAGPDYRCLNDRRVVTALYDAVQFLVRQSRASNEMPTPFELEMYLYKEHDEVSGETFIHAASELDFTTDARREAFLMRLVEYEDWRCIKVVATFVQPLDEKSLDRMMESVRNQSKHRAIKLSDLVHSMIGYGEMIDITEEWSALRPAAEGQV